MSDRGKPAEHLPDVGSIHALILECAAATKAYRDAFTKADRLTRELKAIGLCGHCATNQHEWCRDYGCSCCGGGK